MVVQLENTHYETKSYRGYYSSPNKQTNKTSQSNITFICIHDLLEISELMLLNTMQEQLSSLGIRYILATVSIPLTFV